MSERIIKIFGNASKSLIKEFNLNNHSQPDMNLMDFLRKNSIPIASSCAGEGICKKCGVLIEEQQILSCLITLEQIFEKAPSPVTIKISYL